MNAERPNSEEKQSIAARSAPSPRFPLGGRRKPHLTQVHQRVWYLRVPSLTVTILLVLGVAVSIYPGIRWETYVLGPKLLRILPQVSLGLLALTVLEACYVVARVRETRELRDHILAMSEESGFLGVEYPRDGLTGALDRRALPDVLKRESSWVDRYRIPLSFVLLDIRAFSKFNEKQGNMAGDLVLKDFAQAVQTTMRQTDSVLRYGADEFLCLLPRTDAAGGAAFTRRVRQACQRSPRLRELVIDTGLAVYSAGKDVNVILANAEKDLAARKSLEPPLQPVDTVSGQSSGVSPGKGRDHARHHRPRVVLRKSNRRDNECTGGATVIGRWPRVNQLSPLGAGVARDTCNPAGRVECSSREVQLSFCRPVARRPPSSNPHHAGTEPEAQGCPLCAE